MIVQMHSALLVILLFQQRDSAFFPPTNLSVTNVAFCILPGLRSIDLVITKCGLRAAIVLRPCCDNDDMQRIPANDMSPASHQKAILLLHSKSLSIITHVLQPD